MKIALVLSLMLCGPGFSALGEVNTAVGLANTCTEAEKVVIDKVRPGDLRDNAFFSGGECIGVIEGWLQGIDGAILTENGRGVIASVKWSELPSTGKIAIALKKHLDDTPLDSGKSTDSVLLKVLRSGGLIELKPLQGAASDVQ